MAINRKEQIEAFLKESPNDPFLLYALAMEYLKLKEREKTKEQFDLLVREHPDYIGTYYHFGKILAEDVDFEKSVKILEKGIQTARKLKNQHALSELQGLYHQVLDEMED